MVHRRRLLRLALLALLPVLALFPGAASAAAPAAPPLSHLAADGEERVAVLLPAEASPAPLVEVLGRNEPRVVADFSGVAAWSGPALLEVDSPLVRRVRSWLHRGEQRLRVVLDLAVDPAHLLVTHTYESTPGGLRVLLVLRPIGPHQE